MNLAEAKALLPEIRGVLEFASDEWAVGYDLETGGSQICAREGLAGEVYPIATLLNSIQTDDRELMRKAPIYVRALLVLRDAAVEEVRRLTPKPEMKKVAKTQANICAIMCANDGAFRKWLMECKDLHDAGDAERIKTHVRFLLNVESIAEIDKNPTAAAAWKKMRDDFNTWRNHP